MSTVVVDTYSDQDMACPADWENGRKPARVTRWGESEFRLSHPWSGEWQGSRFTYEMSDVGGIFRAQFASEADRYWTRPQTVRMTSRANRAVKGNPYTVFHGPVVDAQPNAKRRLEVTLGDIVSEILFANQSDKFRIPWRVIGDGFLDQLDAVSDALDRETPEPIIYGQHNRTSTSLATPAGFRIHPIYLGLWTVSGTQYHVWLVAGHACSNLPEMQVDGTPTGEGSAWLIPHQAGFAAEFGAPYVDLRSSTYGNDRRYTLILGKFGEADPNACAEGEKLLTCDVDGIEDVGDSSGTLISDIYQQRKHFDINFVANTGPASYQTGLWLDNPSWDIFGTPVLVVDEDTYDEATAIGIERKPDSEGIQGAAVIGRAAGERYNAPKWDADWNRSSASRSGWTRRGQKRIVLLHPTDAIKAAAPLFSDALHIVKDSFRTTIRWGDQANAVGFRADFDPDGGVWRTTGTRTNDLAIANYEKVIPSETREYPFAPGLSNAQHLADLEVAVRSDPPPRGIALDTGVSVQSQDGVSLADLQLGDYFRYVHFDAVQQTRSIRLAQIDGAGVRVGRRRIWVEAIDCEDLIGYDEDLPGDPDLDVALCPLAQVIDIGDGDSIEWLLDTSDHPTDDSVEGLFPGPGIAYHAAWWYFIAPDDGVLILSTFGSDYDTQIAAFTGPCEALDLVPVENDAPVSIRATQIGGYNDNAAPWLTASRLNVPVAGGETYRILVCGYGPDDGGKLRFMAHFDA